MSDIDPQDTPASGGSEFDESPSRGESPSGLVDTYWSERTRNFLDQAKHLTKPELIRNGAMLASELIRTGKYDLANSLLGVALYEPRSSLPESSRGADEELRVRKTVLVLKVWFFAIVTLVVLGAILTITFHSASMLLPVSLVCLGAGVVGSLLVQLDFINERDEETAGVKQSGLLRRLFR